MKTKMNLNLFIALILLIGLDSYGQDVSITNLVPQSKSNSLDSFGFKMDGTVFGGLALTKVDGTIFGNTNSISLFTTNNRDMTFYSGTGNIIFFPNVGNSNSSTVSSGNIGIGTNDPQTKLEIQGNGEDIRISRILDWDTNNDKIGGIYFNVRNSWNSVDGNGARIESYSDTYNDRQDLRFFTNHGNVTERMRITSSGNIGIGTTNPLDKLAIENGNLRIDNIDGKGIKLYQGDTHRFGQITLVKAGGTGSGTANTLLIEAGNTYGTDYGQRILFKTANTNRFVIEHDGNVGIGTENPDATLSVNGDIHTKEVKVDLTGWSDFVFEDTYELPTLKEVEDHIKQKGHLKDIPSAKEVEENGILLGEMDARLLQKIEELTLYLIGQNKKLEKLKSGNKALQERLLLLEKK